MNAQDFCYWFNGFVELNGGKMPTPEQWKSIQEHLATVFKKVTPKVEEVKQPEVDWKKIAEQLGMRPAQQTQQDYPVYPPPYWWQPGLGVSSPPIAPGTIIC
jgi:hypothetical protein